MTKIKITPKSKRAKERVKQHGETMLLEKELPDKFLVKSMDNTWNNQPWMGWFTENEATFEVIE